MLKFWVRLYTFPFLAGLCRYFGIKWGTIGSAFGKFTLLAQLPKLKTKPSTDPIAENRLDIIFLSVIGGFQTNNSVQVLVAKALQSKGHRVRVVLCDQVFPICEVTEFSNHANRKNICSQCYQFGKNYFEKAGFEVILASSLFQSSFSKSDKWNQYVQSILLRYFKVGDLSDIPSNVSSFVKDAQKSAAISEMIGEAIVKLKPDRVVIGHGVYTTRGPARETINKAGVPLFSISRGKMAETQKFNWRFSGDWWDVSKEWEKVKDVPLTSDQGRAINNYLESRRNHNRDVLVYNHSPEESISSLKEKLEIRDNKPIFTLFTNVLWDATSVQREIAFDNSIEWVLETIKWFMGHPEYRLIVRIHPAESVIGTQQPFLQIINKQFSIRPNHVHILDPKIDINSWSLLNLTDYGLAHTSTVGMELALFGKPCICVAHTHYRGKGFTVDVSSKREYFNSISNAQSILHTDLIRAELAKRYAFLVFIRYQLPFPFFNPKSHIGINSFSTLDLDKMLNHPSLHTVLGAIEEEKEFLLGQEALSDLYYSKC